MPTIAQHTVGTFCWPELMTTDQDAARRFYGALFGWTTRENEMGGSGTYTLFRVGDNDVAACYKMMPEQQSMGIPPNWGSYVAVESADEAAKQAESLGGRILMAPFDVMEHGRMAVIQDPAGAVFSVWEARKHVGATLIDEPGSLGWTQLNTTDPAAVKPFYTALFGWTYRDDPMPDGSGHYTTFLKADGMAGGMMKAPQPGFPSHWLVHFAVDEVDAVQQKAASLGAQTFVPPTDVPGTCRFSVLCDPQGAAFALIKFFPRG